MGIKITLVDNLYCPVIVCDHCGEPIAERGNCEYRVDGNGKPVTEPVFLHKKCDRMYRILQTQYSGIDWRWEEISTVLYQLQNNFRVSAALQFVPVETDEAGRLVIAGATVLTGDFVEVLLDTATCFGQVERVGGEYQISLFDSDWGRLTSGNWTGDRKEPISARLVARRPTSLPDFGEPFPPPPDDEEPDSDDDDEGYEEGAEYDL